MYRAGDWPSALVRRGKGARQLLMDGMPMTDNTGNRRSLAAKRPRRLYLRQTNWFGRCKPVGAGGRRRHLFGLRRKEPGSPWRSGTCATSATRRREPAPSSCAVPVCLSAHAASREGHRSERQDPMGHSQPYRVRARLPGSHYPGIPTRRRPSGAISRVLVPQVWLVRLSP